MKKQQTERREAQAQEETGDGYTLYFVGGLIMVGTVSYLYLNKDRLIKQAKRSNPSDQKKTPADSADKPPTKKTSNLVFAN